MHILTSPPDPLDFVNTEVAPVTRKYKSRNVTIIPIPIVTVFREVFMNDERPSRMNEDRFVTLCTGKCCMFMMVSSYSR